MTGPDGVVLAEVSVGDRDYDPIMGLIVGLLVLWVILSILGFVIHGLLWLAIIGIVLFLVTGAFGLRGRATR